MCVCVILFSHLVTPLLFLLLFPSCRREKTTLARSSHKNFVFRFWRKPSLLLPFAIIIVVGHCCCRAGIFWSLLRSASEKSHRKTPSSSIVILILVGIHIHVGISIGISSIRTSPSSRSPFGFLLSASFSLPQER